MAFVRLAILMMLMGTMHCENCTNVSYIENYSPKEVTPLVQRKQSNVILWIALALILSPVFIVGILRILDWTITCAEECMKLSSFIQGQCRDDHL